MPRKRQPMTRKAAKGAFLASLGFASLIGLITAVTSVHGWFWTTIRILAFVWFVLYGLTWLEAARKERR